MCVGVVIVHLELRRMEQGGVVVGSGAHLGKIVRKSVSHGGAAAQHHAEALLWAGSFAQRGVGGPEDSAKAKAYFTKAAALGNEDAKAALKRIECPYGLKDKRGQVMTNLCF